MFCNQLLAMMAQDARLEKMGIEVIHREKKGTTYHYEMSFPNLTVP